LSVDIDYASWQQRAEAELGISLNNLRAVGGGDFAQSFCATVGSVATQISSQLEIGDNVFIKTHSNPPPQHFSTEAAGLQWMASTHSVNVPEVLGCSDKQPYLALRWIDEASVGSMKAEVQFGRALAEMHKSDCKVFGRDDGRSTGSLGLPNKTCTSWHEFFGSQRLMPLKDIAAQRNALSVKTLKAIDTLVASLADHVATDARPSVLHGDLWAGNRLVDAQGRSWVIDPACFGGHREFDLAMMRLFGGFDRNCHAAYDEAYPLEDGWQDRISLHQLAPLIVHAIKFGRAYVGPTEEALSKYC